MTSMSTKRARPARIRKRSIGTPKTGENYPPDYGGRRAKTCSAEGLAIVLATPPSLWS
jgi:hypothetical protein